MLCLHDTIVPAELQGLRLVCFILLYPPIKKMSNTRPVPGNGDTNMSKTVMLSWWLQSDKTVNIYLLMILVRHYTSHLILTTVLPSTINGILFPLG